jgi:hypothetical protein
MKNTNEIESNLLKELKTIADVQPRRLGRARNGQIAFLQKAEQMANIVSADKNGRHSRLRNDNHTNSVFHRKERSPMFNTLVTIFLATSLFFGTGVATVAASQDSQPGEMLYDIKLASESVRLNLTPDPATQFVLSLDYVAERADEIVQIFSEGGTPSEDVVARYQVQIEQSMAIAAGLAEEDAIIALTRLQIQLEAETQTFMMIRQNASPESEAAFAQVRTMLEERVRLVQAGETNLLQLREQLQIQEQLNNPGQGQQVNGTGGQGSTELPATGSGNPWVEGTPTPGSGYGPGQGTGDCESCTPSPSGQQGGGETDSGGDDGSGNGSGYSTDGQGMDWWWLTLTPTVAGHGR